MNTIDLYKNLEYEYHILLAKYEIGEFNMQTGINIIYENVTQILSLIHIRLCSMTLKKHYLMYDPDTSELLVQVIRDLRYMCKSFHWETELINNLGLIKTIEFQLNLLRMDEKQLQIQGTPRKIAQEKEIMLFRVFQEILLLIKSLGVDTSLSILFIFRKNTFGFTLEYNGESITSSLIACKTRSN